MTLRRMVERLFGRYPRTMATEKREIRTVEPIRIRELAQQVPGQWVALRDDEIVEVQPSLDQLMAALANRCISDVTVLRAADSAEAEMVGFG